MGRKWHVQWRMPNKMRFACVRGAADGFLCPCCWQASHVIKCASRRGRIAVEVPQSVLAKSAMASLDPPPPPPPPPAPFT